MNRRKRSGAWMLILGLSLYLSLFTGCSDSTEDPVPTEPNELDQQRIICNDLSPAPDELAQLTVIVDGHSSGEWPTYTWTATGGSFPETNTGISVKWLTPETPGLYSVRVIGTLGGLADTSSAWIYVRNFQELNTGKKFSSAPRIVNNSLYFFGGADGFTPRSTSFRGYHCYQYSSPGVSVRISNTGETAGGGYDLYIPEEGTALTGSFIRTYYIGLSQQRQDMWNFPLAIGSPVNITNDGGGQILRKNQHVHPYINPYGTRIVWQAELAGPADDGTQDLCNIGHWDNFSNTKVYLTESHDSTQVQIGPDIVWIHRYYRNIRPIFTPDEDLLIYFVDTTGVYEPCLIDIVGGAPVKATRRALDLFDAAEVRVNSNTVFQYNSAMDILGFIDAGRDLCFFYPYLGAVAKVPGIEEVEEMAWSPDGSQCVVSTAGGIWLVSAAGLVSSEAVFTKEKATDGIYGLNWSPNIAEPKIGFRMVRKGRDVEESFSALMISLLNDGVTVYASPSINWSLSYEPDVDYTYMRVVFDQDEVLYAPIPTPPWSGDAGRTVECAIFRSSL